MFKTPNSHKLLLSLLFDQPNIIEKVTLFYTLCIIDLNKKSLGKLRYNMFKITKKTNKKKEKKYSPSKDLPLDQSSLGMKIRRASFVTHCMLNCLNSHYVPLDTSCNGWKFVDNWWESKWFEGSHLPHPDDAVDESSEVDESVMAEGEGSGI